VCRIYVGHNAVCWTLLDIVCGIYVGHNTVHMYEVCVGQSVGHRVYVVHTLDITQYMCMKCVLDKVLDRQCVAHTLTIIQCVGHCWTYNVRVGHMFVAYVGQTLEHM
jgi:hypothetical protein